MLRRCRYVPIPPYLYANNASIYLFIIWTHTLHHHRRQLVNSLKYLVTNWDWLLGTSHSFSDLLAAFLSQVACVPNTEAVLEDLLDFFKGKSRNFWVEEVDEDPAETTDGSVEAECTAWSDSL